jgi:hypothetical protein
VGIIWQDDWSINKFKFFFITSKTMTYAGGYSTAPTGRTPLDIVSPGGDGYLNSFRVENADLYQLKKQQTAKKRYNEELKEQMEEKRIHRDRERQARIQQERHEESQRLAHQEEQEKSFNAEGKKRHIKNLYQRQLQDQIDEQRRKKEEEKQQRAMEEREAEEKWLRDREDFKKGEMHQQEDQRNKCGGFSNGNKE